jgi:hypothetical protein
VASDRRFGLPHPFDADPSGDSSDGRKPGLWETLKRALGTPPAAEPAPLPMVPHVAEPRAPAALPRPAAAASFHPPASPPAAPPRVEPSPPAPVVEIAVEAGLVEVAAGVPFLEDLPVPSPPPVEAPAALPSDPDPPTGIPPAGASETAPAAPRLARGLASFSRDNAEREKKFAHLLRDSGAAGRRRPSGSRKRG